MKIVKSFEESGSLKKVLGKNVKMRQKREKVDFLACFR